MSEAPAPTPHPKLEGYPEEVREAYARFLGDRNPVDLETVVLGAFAFLLTHKPAQPIQAYPDGTELMAGLGADSLAITELVFLLEGIFDITIENEELLKLRTLGDLRAFVRVKIPTAR